MSIKDTITRVNREEELKNNPLLVVPSMIDEVNQNLEKILAKEPPEMPNIPEFPKKIEVEIAGVSIITIKGDKGEKGSDGTNGIDGKDGTNGKDGNTPTKTELLEIIKPLIPKVKNGNDGHTPTDTELLRLIKPLIPKVKDGSPDTSEQIIEKIHTSKAKINKSKIEGLEQEIAELKNAISNVSKNITTQKSGGGMGNVQHESKAVSSGTTTISTTYKISGGGFAVFCFYQGQLVVRGTHYTVGSDLKTLTLTFVPSDSTTIDIIYWRT